MCVMDNALSGFPGKQVISRECYQYTNYDYQNWISKEENSYCHEQQYPSTHIRE